MLSTYRKPAGLLLLVPLAIVILVACVVFELISLTTMLILGTLFYVVFGGRMFHLYSMKRGVLKSEFRKNIVEITVIGTIVFVLFFFAFFTQNEAEKIKAVAVAGDNEFEVYTSPYENFLLRGFRIYYDFNENRGNVTFNWKRREELNQTDYLHISLPSSLKVSSWNTSRNGTLYPDIQDNRISFSDIPFDETFFTIYFHGTMTPSGKFSLYSHAFKTYAPDDVSMEFVMGEYECRPYCFANEFNAIPEVQGDIMTVSYPVDYYGGSNSDRNVLSQRFTMNTKFARAEKVKNDLQNFSVGLFVASLVLFGELVRRLALLWVP